MRELRAAARRRAGVEYQRLADGSAVLVDGRGDAYALNATAAEVWELCDGRGGEALLAALLARYAASPARARRSVAALLARLRRLGLLEPP